MGREAAKVENEPKTSFGKKTKQDRGVDKKLNYRAEVKKQVEK